MPAAHFSRIRTLEEERERLDQVLACFFDGRSLAGNIVLGAESDEAVILPLDDRREALEVGHLPIVASVGDSNIAETPDTAEASEADRRVPLVKRFWIALAVTVLPILVLAQENSTELKHFTAVPANGSRPVSLAALSIEHGGQYPTVIRLKGKVEIKTPVCLPAGKGGAVVCDGEMIVRADEAEFHEDTGEIQAHGNVQVTPLRHLKR
jgi:hypothetical protein